MNMDRPIDGWVCDSDLFNWKMFHVKEKRRLKSEINSNYHAQLNGLIGMRIDFIGNFEIRIS